jgi:vancomycin resistance protein VanJ
MKKQSSAWFHAMAWVYITFVLCWFLAYLTFGDRFGFLAIFNTLAVYLFFPLPLIIIGAFFIKRKALWSGLASLSLILFWLWGGLFIPKQTRVQAHPEDNGNLSVMTYNLLGWNSQAENQVKVIRQADADVVMLQELNYSMSQVVESELVHEYPYQILAPGENVEGMGVISKYPIKSTGVLLHAKHWVGEPQVVILKWKGKKVILVNIHMRPTNGVVPQDVRETSNSRELQAQVILNFVKSKKDVIVAGDTNTTPMSDAYKIMTQVLEDSWKEAGFGFGHTFPGSNIPGSSRPVMFGILSPQWMVRIDYIFHTSQWQVRSARTAVFDGVSDHRGVIAVLDWVEGK